MNDFRFIDIAQNGFDVGCGLVGDEAGFAAAVVAQSASDFAAFRTDAGDGGAAFEFAFNGCDANREQAFAGTQGVHSTGVEDQATGQLQVIGQPLLAGGEGLGL